MSEQPSWFVELDELLNKLCAEALSADERHRLNELLRGGEAQRQHYKRYMHFHAAMKWDASQSSEAVPGFGGLFQNTCDTDLKAPVRRLADAMSGPARVPAVSADSASAPIFGNFGGMAYDAVSNLCHGWPLAYLIAVVTCGIGVLIGSIIQVSSPDQMATSSGVPFRLEMDPKVEFVGRITGLVDCQWNDSEPAVVGYAAVPLGRRYSLASGLAEITYHSGAKVILQGPCVYEVESRAGGYLSVGKVTARVEKKAEGGGRKAESSNPQSPIPSPLFSVRTPTAIVTDLGTEFGVEVDKQGQTTSHVFRGSVEVRAVSGDENATTAARVLHENETAVVKNANGSPDGTDRVTAITASATPVEFVRELPKTTRKTLDLVDVLAGGNGFSGQRGRGIDPTSGRVANGRPPTDGFHLFGDGEYHRVAELPMIDGVFIPAGGKKPAQVDSAGHTFDGWVDPTANETFGDIWAGGKVPAHTGGHLSTKLGDIDYATSEHGLIFLHPNSGITFDLAAIRRANPGQKIVRFCAMLGNTERNSESLGVAGADVWVLIDGRLRFRRCEINGCSGVFSVAIPIAESDRFLTLASTDAGNGIEWDWIIFGDPQLKLELQTPQQ